MTVNIAWQEFVKSGKVINYLNYCSCRGDNHGQREREYATVNRRADYKSKQCR